MSRKSTSEGTFVRNNIRRIREHLGISQGSLAEKVGLSKSYLSRLEASKRRASLDIADKIARELGVTRASIVVDEETSVRTIKVIVRSDVQGDVWKRDAVWSSDKFYQLTMPSNDLYPDIERQACDVVGSAMDRLYPEGSLLIWVSFKEINEPAIVGRRYIIRRFSEKGTVEQTVKTFMRDSEGKEFFYPESTDPKFQTPLALEDTTFRTEIAGRVINSLRYE